MIEPTERAPLGRTGLSVNRLGFGSAPRGGVLRATSEEGAAGALEAAWALGLRYFDTAPQYGSGLAERRLGAFLRQRPRDEFVVSSKVGKLLRAPGTGIAPTMFEGALPYDVVFDYSYDGTLRSFEESLGRLGLDRIDILLVHDVTRRYHGELVFERFEEARTGACRALARLRDEGAIGAWGPALADVDIAARFIEVADVDCLMLPGRYTLLDRSAGDALLPSCAERGIAVLAAAPFDSGILATGAIEGATYAYRAADDAVRARVHDIEAVCRTHSVPLPAAALQFPFSHPAVTSVVAGMRSPGEVAQDIALMRLRIARQLWRDLNASR